MTANVQFFPPDDVGHAGLLLPADALFGFRDHEPTVLPTEDNAGVIDFEVPAAHTEPTIAQGQTGPSRVFDGDEAYQARDVSTATLAPQSVTYQGIILWDYDANVTAGTGAASLAVRGLGDGTAVEFISWAVALSPLPAGKGQLLMGWDDGAGTFVPVAGAEFFPRSDQFMLVTAVREWRAPDDVVVRYFIGPDLIGEEATTDGVIGGGVGGGVVIGARATLGTFGAFFFGKIDQFSIYTRAMSGDEIRCTWDRLVKWQPGMYAEQRALAPRGKGRTKDLGSQVERHHKAQAQLVGVIASSVDCQRAGGLPDRAWGGQLEGWEGALGLSPRPGDTIASRRLRAKTALLKPAGYSAPAIQDTFAEILGLDPVDVEILSYDHVREDDFSAALDPLKWVINPGGGTIAAAAGLLEIDAVITGSILWDGATRDGPELYFDTPAPTGTSARATLVSLSAPTTTFAGLVGRGTDGSRFWLGRRDADIIYRVFDGVSITSTVVWLTPGVGPPDYLRLTCTGTNLVLDYSDVGPADVDVTDTLSLPLGPLNCTPGGYGLAAWDDTLSLTGAVAARFDDFLMYSPNGLDNFTWWVYRDPLLPGSYDLKGARNQMFFQHAARDIAGVATTRAVECDDPENGCDNAPLGEYP